MNNLAKIKDQPWLIKPLLSKASWTAQDIVSAAEIPVETKLAMALTPELLTEGEVNRFCYEMAHKALALVNSRHIPCILVLQLKQAAPDSQHYAVRWARAWQEAYAQERPWQLQCLAAILEGKEPAY